jgi:hypothetical protein
MWALAPIAHLHVGGGLAQGKALCEVAQVQVLDVEDCLHVGRICRICLDKGEEAVARRLVHVLLLAHAPLNLQLQPVCV